jgi:hypothetical protein
MTLLLWLSVLFIVTEVFLSLKIEPLFDYVDLMELFLPRDLPIDWSTGAFVVR